MWTQYFFFLVSGKIIEKMLKKKVVTLFWGKETFTRCQLYMFKQKDESLL